jgi:hypothetical protein
VAKVVRAVQVDRLQQGITGGRHRDQRPAVTSWSTSTVARPAVWSSSKALAMVAGRMVRRPEVLR